MDDSEPPQEKDIGLERPVAVGEEEAYNDDKVSPLPKIPLRINTQSVSFGRAYDYLETTPVQPPTFAQSEFETITRRLRNSNPRLLKVPNTPSRFPNLDNLWEFAKWGSMSYLELTQRDIDEAALRLRRTDPLLGPFRASTIAGNDMYGSVFYTLPVAAACGIFAPIALLAASLILWLFRPILLELGSAIRFNGTIYAYCLQCSGKTMALIAAAAIFLDGVATASVSAATVSSYISGELNGALTFTEIAAFSIGILIVLGAVALTNLKNNSGMGLSITAFHLGTMGILMVASVIAWARSGSAVIMENWRVRPTGASHVLRDIFFGICVSFIDVTGYETTPTYIEHIHPKAYKSTLSICIWIVTLINVPVVFLTYALLPQDTILSGGNVLSMLAEQVAGKWLRYIVVADCVLVVGGGGVLAGFIVMCSLLQNLAEDRVIPTFFLVTISTGSAPWAVAFSVFVAIILYASSGFQLGTLSSVFSVAFLVVMLMYAVSNVLLKFNRDRLPRNYQATLTTTFLAVGVILVVLIGNVVNSPKTLGLFAAYFGTILLYMLGLKERITLGRIALWLYDHVKSLHRWRFARWYERSIVGWMDELRRAPVCVWVKTDEIYNLVEAVLYVRRNELTSHVIFIHAYQNALDIPSELDANIKILNEAFPTTTIDLVFLQGSFNPTLVEAASAKLDVPKSQMFTNTMGSEHGYTLADYGGVRVANL